MRLQTFEASSAAEALAHIRSGLGPEAVVWDVRRVPASGWQRLWRRPRIQVLAGVPETETRDLLHNLQGEIAQLRQQLCQWQDRGAAPSAPEEPPAPTPTLSVNGWMVTDALERMGLLPIHVRRVLDELERRRPGPAPASLAEQLALCREVLAEGWRQTPSADLAPGRPEVHIFLGPRASGKTTCLAKWLTQAVLLEGRAARVWRLDGRSANTAEGLEVHCEILQVPLERKWRSGAVSPTELHLVDLPGVDWLEPGELEDLGQRLREFPSPAIHLVLNAAYDVGLLLAQARAFAGLGVSDLVLSHLDEESRRGKAWNLIWGTNFSISFLSAGQNVPGSWRPATVESLLEGQFPCK